METDGLYPSRIHALSYTDGTEIKSTNDYDEMRDILSNSDLFIGHNIVRYDIPVIERLLGIKIEGRVIDTLALSWYLYPNRVRHGLESWGDTFNHPKPKIDDWENLSYADYRHRCESDVEINRRLFDRCSTYLERLYGQGNYNRLISYLTFKLECAREQEEEGWELDTETVDRYRNDFRERIDVKVRRIKEAMPPVEIVKVYKPPEKPYKKDGTLSVAGSKWIRLMKEQGLSVEHREPVEVTVGVEEPNPNSPTQIKKWLYGLGWKPTTVKWSKDKDGNEYTIDQVRVDVDGVKELCPSVLALAEKEPAIRELEELTVLTHRLSILDGYVNAMTDGGLVKAEISGLTNTLRFKHKAPCVNLPGVAKPYGEVIRGVLVAKKGSRLCGSDVSSLEENTKKHYIFPYDPDYVRDMSTPGFDAHLDLARQAGAVTQEQIDAYNNGDTSIKPIRTKFKPVNYAAIYGAQAKRLARETGLPVSECQALLDIYWERNWAVLALVDDLEVKNIDGQKWLFNPVSRLYYSLRFDKDRFSTLNQGTGVFVFDTWVREVRKRGYRLTAQFHDEIVLNIPEGQEDKCRQDLTEAMVETNRLLKLNVEIGVDVQFGKTYAEIH